jgi:hypothetical protein
LVVVVGVTDAEDHRKPHAAHLLNRSHLHRWGSLTLVTAACVVLAAGTPRDDEEFRYAVLTSRLHVRALSEWTYAFWTSRLALGLPQPFIPNFWFHPLLPLLAVLQPATWVRLLLLAQTVFGAAGMWRVGRLLGFRPIVRAVCAFTFLLAGPGINYALTDTWPSHWIAWTSMPWLLLCVWRTLDTGGLERWRSSVAAGLVAGLVIASANPAYLVVYTVLIVAVIAARWRSIAERWLPLTVAAVIALLIAAPNAAALISERRFFRPALGFLNDPTPLPMAVVWDVFLRPLSRFAPQIVSAVDNDARTLSFGGPFALLTIAACVYGGWSRAELVFALCLGLAFLFTTLGPTTIISQRYQFRDPVTLCAILLAGMAAERGLQRQHVRHVTGFLLALQIAAVASVAAPYARYAWDETRSAAPWFRAATAATPAADALVSALARPGLVAFSPRVEREVMNTTYLAAGIGVNGLAYRGVHVLDGWFKGVSADPIWPDERLFYARIAPPQPFLESAASLDVLGVRYVLAQRGEPVAPGLRERPLNIAAAQELVLYENEDARTGAILMDTDADTLHVPLLARCPNEHLLCRDLSALAKQRPAAVTIVRKEGAIDVAFERADRPRTLVIAEMYRPAWTARTADQHPPTFAFLNSMLAVRVPAGATSVHFAYRPTLLYAASLAAWMAIVAALFVLRRLR